MTPRRRQCFCHRSRSGRPQPRPVCATERRQLAYGNTLLNLNSFPADNDADVWDCNDELVSIIVNGNGGDDFVTGKGGNGTGDRPTSTW